MSKSAIHALRNLRAWVIQTNKAVIFAGVLCASAQAQLAVTDGGSPTFTFPIVVPPGVAGRAPQLALAYTGGGGNTAGQGWTLQGISTITRCPPIKAIDGFRGVVNYASSDKLCLDGQRLIQTDESGDPSANQNASGVAVAPQTSDARGLDSGQYREFRTEKDSFARIRAYGKADSNGAGGPAYFKVWTKSGQIIEYGATPALPGANALIRPSAQSTTAMVWAVARISDTQGNSIDFQYSQSDQYWGSGENASANIGREWNVTAIQYGANKIAFKYDARKPGTPQDGSEAYYRGSKNLSLSRLASITTYVNGGSLAVKTYKLGYSIGARSGRSRLGTVQECAGDGSTNICMPATTFTYADGGDDRYKVSEAFRSGPLATGTVLQDQEGKFGLLPADFDGDGKTDFIRWADDISLNQLYLSKGNGEFRRVANGTGPSQFNIVDSLFRQDGCYYSMVTDMDGDGLADILRYASPVKFDGSRCDNPGPHYVFLNSGNGSFTRQTLTGPVLNRQASKGISNCIQYIQNSCAEWGEHPGWSEGSNFYLLDLNGDGKLDIVTTVLPRYGIDDIEQDACLSQVCTRVWIGKGDGRFEESPTNMAHRSMYSTPAKYSGPETPKNVVDVDGDGYSDLTGMSKAYFNKSQTFRSLGNGDFEADGGFSPCDLPLDFNGDGLADCLTASVTTPVSNSLLVSDGVPGGVLKSVSGFNLKTDLLAQQGDAGRTAGVAVLDVNGDGRQDLLRWKDSGGPDNLLYQSNGDGTFKLSSSFSLAGVGLLQKSDRSAAYVLGDFTGRGNTEILRTMSSPSAGDAASNVLLVKVDPTPPDQLVSVRSGTGAVTTLYYVPLSDSKPVNAVSDPSARYAGDRGTAYAATGRTIDFTPSLQVVATSVSSNGIGGVQKTEFSYAGMKADLDGRGVLGFREVRRQSTAPDGSALTSVTQYLQTHPYVGAVMRGETYLGTLNSLGGTALNSTTNVYCDKTSSMAPSAATAAMPCPHDPAIARAKVQKPYLAGVTTTGSELAKNGGAPLPTVVTQNDYNGSGDPVSIVVTTSGTGVGQSQRFVKTVANEYVTPEDTACTPDGTTCNWVLGRLKRSRVTNSVPDNLASLSVSAGNNPNASATAGVQPAPTIVLVRTPSPMKAGTDFRVDWRTTNATSLSYACTASGTGYKGSGPATVPSGYVSGPADAAWVGYPSTCTWTAKGPGGTSTYVETLTTRSDAPTIEVTRTPATMVAGQNFRVDWKTTNAASLRYDCTANGTGYKGSGPATVPTGYSEGPADAGWVNYPSTCTWTATGPGGTKTFIETLNTVPAAPTLQVKRTPSTMVAGQYFRVDWTTSGATSLSYSCTAAGTGYKGSGPGSVPTGYSEGPADAGWVGYPSTCTWTAIGPGGTKTYVETLTTVQAPPTIQVTRTPSPMVAGQRFRVDWTTTNATALSYSCVASGTGYAGSGPATVPNGYSEGPADAGWVGYPSTCTWTATGPGGTKTYVETLTTTR